MVDLNRRSFLGVVLGAAAVAGMPPLVARADEGDVDPNEEFVGFIHLKGGEILPLGKITEREDGSWYSEPYLATEMFTVVAWSLYRRGRKIVDRRPRKHPVTLCVNDTITLDLEKDWCPEVFA